MSAWRVNKKTLSYLTSYTSRKINDNPNLEIEAKKLNMKNSSDIFNKMQELNNLALRERYEDADKFFGLNTVYTFKPNGIPNLYQVSKSFHYFLYQCAEGKAYKSKVYKFFKKVSDNLMYDLVSDNEDYINAEWE